MDLLGLWVFAANPTESINPQFAPRINLGFYYQLLNCVMVPTVPMETATKAPPNQISMARAPFGALLRNALSESLAQKDSFWAHTLLSEFAAFFSLEKGGANAA